MYETAQVISLGSLADFKAALVQFRDQARQAVCAIELEIHRSLDWLSHEQVDYWRAEMRRRENAVTEAKAALDRARMSATFGDDPACHDEVIALRRARMRLEEAESKIDALKRWIRILEKEVDEFRSSLQLLDGLLDINLPRGADLLEKLLAALAAYTQAPLNTQETGIAQSTPAVAQPPLKMEMATAENAPREAEPPGPDQEKSHEPG